MKTCRLCARVGSPDEFLAGKAKRPSSTCVACRAKLSAQHRRKFYAGLGTDKRHTLTQRKRAEDYGTEHVEYSRLAIFARWGGMCAYCDSRAVHLDHVVPLSRGGGDVESNMVPACARCNLSKGAKSLAEWAGTFGPEPPPF